MTTLLTIDHDVFTLIIDNVYKRRKELNDILFNTIVANYRYTSKFLRKRYYLPDWGSGANKQCFLHLHGRHRNKSPLISNELPRKTLIKTMEENNVLVNKRHNRKQMCLELMKQGAICYDIKNYNR